MQQARPVVHSCSPLRAIDQVAGEIGSVVSANPVRRMAVPLAAGPPGGRREERTGGILVESTIRSELTVMCDFKSEIYSHIAVS